MNYFLDTNVIIGHIFEIDSLYKKSLEIFLKEGFKIFSENVKIEVKNVFQSKIDDIKEFIYKLCLELNKNKRNIFISKSEANDIISKGEKIGKINTEEMKKIIDAIWERYEFKEEISVDKFLSILINFNRFYKTKLFQSKEDTLKNMCLIQSHSKKDEKILEMIKEKQLKKLIHDEDEDILFDLNEYAKHHPELDLCFVSWDDDFIKTVKILLDQLSFNKYIGRHESKIK